MSEKTVNLNIRLPKETANKFKNMTKQQLVESLMTLLLEVDCLMKDKESTQLKLDLAESYIAQAKEMIDAVTSRWDQYDI